MQLPIGKYGVDLENSARILSGAFTSRFEMQPGYEQAVSEFFRALRDDPVIAAIRLEINTDSLVLDNGEERSEYPIQEHDFVEGMPQLLVKWGGKIQTFTIHTIEPGSIQLQSKQNQLGSYAWREISTGEPG
jgi:hypothetical protein